MITIDLPPHSKARLWLNDMPRAYYEIQGVVERSVNANAPFVGNVRHVAVELLAQKGERALYGLLGVEIGPNYVQQVTLSVRTSGNNGERFTETLAPPLEDVRIGLPKEYANSVIEGALEEIQGLYSCILIFNCAAHGMTGSSNSIFRKLSGILVRTITSIEGIVPETEQADILRSDLNRVLVSNW